MSEADRMQEVYRSRSKRIKETGSPYKWDKAHLFLKHQRQRALMNLFCQMKTDWLDRAKLLEIGCGRGGVLQEMVSFGFRPRNLYGVDIIKKRVFDAQSRLPALVKVMCGDGQNLPFPDNSFHVVVQFMMLSSILDEQIRSRITREMVRVLAHDGVIIWYDFWTNPTNPETIGIRPSEIKSCFPGCQLSFQKVTLAPPIARKLVPISWGLASALEATKLFNSHYLVIIRK